jgi:hypothetical protein
MRNLLGVGIWFGMLLQQSLISAAEIIACVVWGARAPFMPYSGKLLDTAWRVILLDLLRIPANLTMWLWILLWDHLPSGFQYALNTADDQDPINQGWNSKANKEKQVIWVRDHCGDFWRRVYWLQRNCLYGLSVWLRRSRPDFATVQYVFLEGFVVATSNSGIQIMRATKRKVFGRWLIFYFGSWLGAYLNTIAPLQRNPTPEDDATKDVGGVPTIKVKWKTDVPF